jgi:hypothetical protein
VARNGAPTERRRGLDDQTQRRLLSLLAIGLSLILTRPINRFIAEMVPERRGVADDITEAALQGLVRAASILAASVAVRKLAGSRR